MDANEYIKGLLKSIAGIAQFIETPHEERMVGRHDNEATGLCVSTVQVFDTDTPFETAILHPDFAKDSWVVVECYNDRETAERGHDKWVGVMTAEKLPGALVDVSTAFAAKMCRDLGDPLIFEKGYDDESKRRSEPTLETEEGRDTIA